MGMKTCRNGHKYDDTLPECPFCPKAAAEDLGATVIDGRAGDGEETEWLSKSARASADATRIVGNPSGRADERPGGPEPSSKRTRIVATPSAGKQPRSEDVVRDVGKLIGWVVTFSWNPLGDDYRIREGKTRIGSDPTAEIVLKDALVSADHAVLLHRGNALRIRDSFSTNGTFVNGQDVEDEPVVLKDGDTIKVGNTEFKLRLIEEAKS